MMSSSISKGSTIDAYRRKGCPFLSNKIWRESYCARWLDGSCKVYPLIDMMSLLHKFETSLPIIVLQFVSTCLLPVPTDVFLRHGRVEKEVGVLEERRNWGRTPTLQRSLGQVLLGERYHLKTHQSPLVKGNSSCSVHVGSEKDSLHITVILSSAYTLQKVGRLAQSRCPV